MVNDMPRPRTASSILEAKGAFKANPQRKRTMEPEVKSPFDSTPPKSLDEFEIECWHEIIKSVPAGVLTGADMLVVEMVAILLAEFRIEKAGMSSAHITRLANEMGKLGLNPSGRAGLVVEKPKVNQFV